MVYILHDIWLQKCNHKILFQSFEFSRKFCFWSLWYSLLDTSLARPICSGSCALLDIEWDCQLLRSRICFLNGVWAHLIKSCGNSFCCNSNSNNPIRSQICTCHDSSAVMARAKLWHDQINIIHKTATHIFTKFGLWARKSFRWLSARLQ